MLTLCLPRLADSSGRHRLTLRSGHHPGLLPPQGGFCRLGQQCCSGRGGGDGHRGACGARAHCRPARRWERHDRWGEWWDEQDEEAEADAEDTQSDLDPLVADVHEGTGRRGDCYCEVSYHQLLCGCYYSLLLVFISRFEFALGMRSQVRLREAYSVACCAFRRCSACGNFVVRHDAMPQSPTALARVIATEAFVAWHCSSTDGSGVIGQFWPNMAGAIMMFHGERQCRDSSTCATQSGSCSVGPPAAFKHTLGVMR